MWRLLPLLALQLKVPWVAWLHATESLVTQYSVTVTSYSEPKGNEKYFQVRYREANLLENIV